MHPTRLALTFCLVLAPAAAAQQTPAPAPTVTGTWALDVTLDAGSGTAAFTLTQDGETIKGRYTGTLGEAEVKGTIKGADVQFSFESEAGTVAYKGKIDGDTMAGACVYGMLGEGTFKGKRTKGTS